MSDLGQLIITGISGVILTEEEKEFIEKENIGGVILFANNYESPKQLAELVNSIQVLRKEYPLFIAVDNEGGRVFRFKQHFSQIPAAFELARLDSPKILFHITKIQAEEYFACGVNLNLAPVCDIWNNPDNKVIGDRAYGVDAENVSKCISSVIRGLQTNGVMACAKHFPGHGGTTKDSHLDLPFVKKSLEELRCEEFLPFIKAVKSRVEFAMMAHLQVDAIDTEWPTSLSPKAYGILREELKFTKLILTDDMEMKAITDRWSIEEAAVQAIGAGADIVEYRSMGCARKALEGLKEAKKTKKLKNEVIKDRFDRIMDCKKNNLSEFQPVYIPEIAKKIGRREAQVLLDEVRTKMASF